jgi:PKD domain
VTALALAAAVAYAWPTAASADQTVVSATIYPSSGGNVSQVSVGLQALEVCPEYSGSNPIYLYPPGQPFQLTETSWSLSTVLSCGLQIPIDDVNSVQILNPSQGFEAPLSNADLTDPTRYQDPQAPDALPVISVDGTENQTTYIRPFRGGADANARDEVTEGDAPITLVVYANGPPLIVQASARTLSSNATATTAQLSAAVQTATGTPVPPSGLAWSWTFGDGGTSAAATPTHRFAAGSYEVTVQVTDATDGTGGTATIQFRTPVKPTSGHTNQTGGKQPTKSTSPTGTENGKHSKHPGGQTGSPRSAGSGGARSTTTSSQSTTTAQATTTPTQSTPSAKRPTTITASAPTPPAATTTTTTAPPPHRTSPRRRTPATPTAPAGPVVTGRLISDVTTLPESSSPLVHLIPAAAAAPPQVRQATRSQSLAAPGAALGVALLLGLGASWELRGRRRWRAVSSSS